MNIETIIIGESGFVSVTESIVGIRIIFAAMQDNITEKHILKHF
jgi:hypothetical protein